MIDEQLVIRVVIGGDVEAFRLLVDRYQKPVLSMVSHILNDSHLCEDVAQDVFFAASRKLASFDPARSEFSTWLFTIARNKALNARKRKKEVVGVELPETGVSSEPSDELRRRELNDRLDQALEKLPKRQRVAFILAEFENLPYEQIAQIEGAMLGTIKSRISRARKKVRGVLEEFR